MRHIDMHSVYPARWRARVWAVLATGGMILSGCGAPEPGAPSADEQVLAFAPSRPADTSTPTADSQDPTLATADGDIDPDNSPVPQLPISTPGQGDSTVQDGAGNGATGGSSSSDGAGTTEGSPGGGASGSDPATSDPGAPDPGPGTGGGATSPPASLHLAVALTPPHFPNHTQSDMISMLQRAAGLGGAVSIQQWDDPSLLTSAQNLMSWSQSQAVPVILGLNSTALQERAQLIVPAALQPPNGAAASYSTQSVRDRFISDCAALASLAPPDLCLGTEVNLLAEGDAGEFDAFVTLYHAAYDAVKAISPETKVFVSFQWDVIYLYTKAAGGVHAASAGIIDAFRPRLDCLALTSYPAHAWTSPDQVPADLYQKITLYAQEPVMLMELGWPSGAGHTPQDQAAFVTRLPALLAGSGVQTVGWSLLCDVPTSFMPATLGTTGLIDTNDIPKPAWTAFLNMGGT